MSNIYFWSDMHLGDENVAGFRGYSTTSEHDDAVTTAWAETIRPRDIVYFLGDLSIHDVQGALDTMRNLPGRKRAIWGNHDPAHPMFRKSHTWKPRFLEVFETGDSIGCVRTSGALPAPAMLSHFPFAGDHTEQDRHTMYRLREAPGFLLHGHVHDLWYTNGRQYNVGVDVRPTPVPLDQIGEWMLAHRPKEDA